MLGRTVWVVVVNMIRSGGIARSMSILWTVHSASETIWIELHFGALLITEHITIQILVVLASVTL